MSLNLIPCTRGLPLIGSVPQLLYGQHDYLLRTRDMLGDLYAFDLWHHHVLVLNRPEHAQHVLQKHSRNYAKGGIAWEAIREVLGNGLIASEGPLWLRQRRTMQPYFKRIRIESLANAMIEGLDAGLATWHEYARNGEPVDLVTPIQTLTMAVMMNTLLGCSMHNTSHQELARSIVYVMEHIAVGLLVHSLPSWVPTPSGRRFRRELARIHETMDELLDTAQPNRPDNLLDPLRQATDPETGQPMGRKQLREELLNLVIAGYETTSLALAWTMHFLTQSPEHMQKVRQEVDTVLGTRTPTLEDLVDLPYTKMALHESLRIRPTAWWIPRTAVEDDIIDGIPIAAGTQVVVLLYAIHHHPDHWERPLQYYPEHFTPEAVQRRNPMAWLPFGFGPRQCIGKHFAMLEAQLALAMMIQRYSFVTAHHNDKPLGLSVMMRPKGGVKLRLEPRKGFWPTVAKPDPTTRTSLGHGSPGPFRRQLDILSLHWGRAQRMWSASPEHHTRA